MNYIQVKLSKYKNQIYLLEKRITKCKAMNYKKNDGSTAIHWVEPS